MIFRDEAQITNNNGAMLALCGAEGSGKSTVINAFREAVDYYKWETAGTF